MPIEIIVGLPGSGKTNEIVRRANYLRSKKEPVFLFVPRTRETEGNLALAQFGSIASRTGALTTVDHFVPPLQARRILLNFMSSPPVTLLFDEAQYYGVDFVELWKALSIAGHSVVVSTPSQPQIDALADMDHSVTRLGISCNLLDDGDATEFFVLPERHTTLAVCSECARQLQNMARASIKARLIANEPHPGEPVCYQPIPLQDSMFVELQNLRPDSAVRGEIMNEIIARHIGPIPYRQMTYLDVGCNTGFFCETMARAGFRATGVDVVDDDIALARVLDSWLYRSFSEYICSDAIGWLEAETRTFEVVSSFSVFQWLYIQHPKDRVDHALELMFRMVNKVLFFEMGYGAEKHYEDTAASAIDRDWVWGRLRSSGRFQSVDMIPAERRD